MFVCVKCQNFLNVFSQNWVSNQILLGVKNQFLGLSFKLDEQFLLFSPEDQK